MYRSSRVFIFKVVSKLKNCRYLADSSCGPGLSKKGLVLGAYDGNSPGELKLTPTAAKFDEEMGGNIRELIKGSGIRKGIARVFSNVSSEFVAIAVAGLGPEGVGYNQAENLDQCRENIRMAAGAGTVALQDQGVGIIFVEGFTDAEAAAEGASLAAFRYQEFKNKDRQLVASKVELFSSNDRNDWERGILKAECQNLARKLEETPGNVMTPSLFTQAVLDSVCSCGVQADVKDRDWIEQKKMQGFLNVSRGSCEQPLFLRLSYCGYSAMGDKPVVLVGKGVTFDCGGLCLKNAHNMSEYRADLAGAAVIVATMKAVAQIAIPVNIQALIPLCENMIGGMAMKPGDIVVALNGKSISVEDTDNEGRLMLADALSFAKTLDPCLTVDVATLTPAMKRALGGGPTGAFCSSDVLWRQLNRAGAYSGDRVWRFPFWKHFSHKITDYVGVDVSNVGGGLGGSSCLGAAFLLEFAPAGDFIHLDITGTGRSSTGIGYPYLRKGIMTGRPTRTLIEFIYQLACPHDKQESVC
ncbi:hypothetical protein O3M35_006839 [Rhynocoris fuscipes]|uniref:Cytosol aminopeptidase n=1 Tax=Rhynocoris fuscipes TaxID=488301 RepID=A0AAW1DG98_9HEMI